MFNEGTQPGGEDLGHLRKQTPTSNCRPFIGKWKKIFQPERAIVLGRKIRRDGGGITRSRKERRKTEKPPGPCG